MYRCRWNRQDQSFLRKRDLRRSQKKVLLPRCHPQKKRLNKNQLHLPEQIIIPMSVIFRFFPTVVEEYNAIGDAMKMRGIRFGGGKASAMLEYRLVPVIMCSVKIGEELNAAALTRGLGGPVKRTNICEIGFHVQDVIFLLICLGAFAAQTYVLATRG